MIAYGDVVLRILFAQYPYQVLRIYVHVVLNRPQDTGDQLFSSNLSATLLRAPLLSGPLKAGSHHS